MKMNKTQQEFRWMTTSDNQKVPLYASLSKLHGRKMVEMTLNQRKYLNSVCGEPQALLLDFNFSEDIVYEAGDNVGICPSNETADVKYLKDTLLDNPPSNVPLILETYEHKQWMKVDDIPLHLTYDEILTYITDLKCVPSQDLLCLFLTNSVGIYDQRKLKTLVEDWGSYEKWRNEEPTLCDALREFPSVRISSAELIGRLTVIQNRLYSIASAPSKSQASLVIGVVEYSTPMGSPKVGLCTGEFLEAKLGTKFPGFIRPAVGFSLIEDHSKPIIMIGAGSGIAPFRGFWQIRSKHSFKGENVGSTVLFYGCRVPGLDLLRDETDAFTSNGLLNWAMSIMNLTNSFPFERYTAYSRIPGKPRKYVQDLVEEKAALVWNLWQQKKGIIYVCGKIAMATGVQNALENIVRQYGDMGREDSKLFLDRMKAEGRYQEDIFGDH